MRRIEAHDHRGVLLLHDIHPATAMALPTLLKELKATRLPHRAGGADRRAAEIGARAPGACGRRQRGGWPRLAKTGTSSADKAVKTTQHRQHSKRLARGERDTESKPAHRGKRFAHNEGGRKSKTARHGKRLAHHEPDPDITASIAKKKRKPQTAEQSQGRSRCAGDLAVSGWLANRSRESAFARLGAIFTASADFGIGRVTLLCGLIVIAFAAIYWQIDSNHFARRRIIAAQHFTVLNYLMLSFERFFNASRGFTAFHR